MKEVVIVSAARTAMGSFGGSLAGVSAVELGVTAAKGAIERAGIDASLIDEAIVGNVLGAVQVLELLNLQLRLSRQVTPILYWQAVQRVCPMHRIS